MDAKIIAAKNDLMRQTMEGCRIVITEGVRALPYTAQALLIEKVKEFSEFNQGNDPHEEHDFGKITLEDTDFFWKFDYFDDTFEHFQENGNRVLTIMRADEY